MSQQASMRLNLTLNAMVSSKLILKPTQAEVTKEAGKNVLYALGTSSGKTLISIHHYIKHNEGEPLLIVAPPVKILEGGWNREIAFVEQTYNIKIDYTTLSYGKLRQKDVWRDYKGYYVIFDECQAIKNPTSNQGKMARKLIDVSTGWCMLSATPMSNGWGDSINYFIINGFIKNKTQFEREFAVKEIKRRADGGQYPVIKDYIQQDKVKKWFNSFTVERPTDYFHDLPEIQFEEVLLPSSPTYKKIKKDRVLKLDDETILFDTQPKLQAGLRYWTNPKAKLEWLEMLLDGTDENVLIFYHFNRERDDIRNLAEKLGKQVFEVSGQEKSMPSHDTWDDLRDSVTIVQYQAGGSGIELQYNSLCVIYTPTYSYQDYIQALGRAQRVGMKKRLTVYQLKTKGTVEMEVYKALEEKKDFTDQLFNNYMEGET
ncbi:DEAD/DEAH box helicase [Macrococcus brunensis]|uniref:helicase-related protein n=1 Tax=Macrococcus brunensis TaxID=198483 RepID=UPI001EF15C99|nr:DEAD/DEAH box helicase [Macrococcus brunensis]ULG73189.1 DEAD/DEAH box helicase [Macrococcus brunensis]